MSESAVCSVTEGPVLGGMLRACVPCKNKFGPMSSDVFCVLKEI